MKPQKRIAIQKSVTDELEMIRTARRLLMVAGVTVLGGLIVFYPYHDGALRYGLPLSLAAIWLSLLHQFWAKKWLWFGVLMLPTLALVPFSLPVKELDCKKMREMTVEGMRQQVGAPYLWGGESSGGIDCSGLPRRALRDALLETGWKTKNGAGFRGWAEQWWFDTSAKALGQNYRGFTRPLGIAGKLRDLDSQLLLPADLAITADGRHVMVFMGDGNWIQADPRAGKVVLSDPKMDDNPWYDSQVRLHRWSVLDE